MDQTAANDMANTKPVSNSDTSRSQWNDRMDQGLEPRSSTCSVTTGKLHELSEPHFPPHQ